MERERKRLVPYLLLDQDIPLTEKTKFQIFLFEIIIKVKQGQKQLIYLNEQRYFARKIGNTFYWFDIWSYTYARKVIKRNQMIMLFIPFHLGILQGSCPMHGSEWEKGVRDLFFSNSTIPMVSFLSS